MLFRSISSALTNSGTLLIRWNKSGMLLTNSSIKGASTFAISGTLSLTNIGAGIATAGDRFKLFSATNASGFFTAISPATPGVGLNWNTSALVSSGILSVVLGSLHPQVANAFFSGSNWVMSGSGGAAGYVYSVLAATDLAAPLASWSLVGAGTFDAAGNFIFTNVLEANSTRKFYVIRIQ